MGAWIRTVAVSVIAAATAVAQDAPGQRQNYQIELTGGFTTLDTDGGGPEINQLIAEGTYHLAPVALQNHPWNEAAFLEHSMFVTAGLRFVELEIGPADADGIVFGAGFRYADKKTPVAAEINFRTGTLDGDFGDIDTTNVDLSAGYWLMSNAIVGIDYAMEELDPDGAGSFEETRIGVFGKIVHDLGDKRAVNLEAHIGQATIDAGTEEDNLEFRVEGDFYFTPLYSAGLLLQFSSGDAVSDEGTTIGVRGSAWITPNVGIRAELTTFSASDSAGNDQDEIGIFVDVWL